jgi:hypothetical protein
VGGDGGGEPATAGANNHNVKLCTHGDAFVRAARPGAAAPA